MKEITACLNFDGNCREAMTFYQKCLNAELHLMTFAEMPGCNGNSAVAEAKDRIMHSRLSKGATVLMASDTLPGHSMPFQQGSNFWVALGCESVLEIEEAFNTLSDKGKVMMPLQETFWATRFGMFTDKFGIHWMLNLDKPKAA